MPGPADGAPKAAAHRRGASMEDRPLTAAEAARALRVSRQTVYRLIRSGRLPAWRIGRSWRIRQADLVGSLRPTALEAASERETAGPAGAQREDGP